MKITRAQIHTAAVPLRRPYAVAHHSTDAAHLVCLRLDTDRGACGLGAATPEPAVNGDTLAAAIAALGTAAEALRGTPVAAPATLATQLAALPSPAAQMALDLALHDLWAKALGRPLVDLLGRAHRALPTSVTIGLGDVAQTLAEAAEHRARGFTVLKIKIGEHLDVDVERLQRLRERFGPALGLRVDANCGYRRADLQQFLQRTADLDLQFLEQPLPPEHSTSQRALPPAVTARLMADESLHTVHDARALAPEPRPFGAWNVKLAKCGGILAARDIAAVAERHGIDLMWGCMDESRIAIAGALHAALACPATRWLDLDGHLDLDRDFATGGFALVDGVLHPLDRPGLGLEPGDWR